MATFSTQALHYQRDSADLILRIGSLSRPALLDSGLGTGAGVCHDILAAEPVAWLHSDGGAWRCSDKDIEIDPADLFTTIRLLLHRHLPAPHPTNETLPFTGGAIGCLGYPALAGKSRIEMRDVCIGIYAWAVVVDHTLQRTTFVAADSVDAATRARVLAVLTEGATAPAHFALNTAFTRELSRENYDQAFAAIKDYIGAGDCYQVNLTQRMSAAVSGSPLAVYLQLRARMSAPFSAYLHWADSALLSVSPERFVQLSGDAVLTQPIKGTRPRHRDPKLDQAAAAALQASEKDQAENLMIVDLLRNDLGRVCVTGSVQTQSLFELRSYSNVHHLVSSVCGRLLPNLDGLDLLRACFPGGSITGAPKLRAMAIIEELEQAPRRVYCGTVFYLSRCGRFDSNITIRSLLWEAGQLSCWAGGGIVDDSEVDAEYAECFDKIDAIIQAVSERSLPPSQAR